MYSQLIITSLVQRIGFGSPQEDGFNLVIDEAIRNGVSGREFKNFHALVTIENIYATVDKVNESEDNFNAILDGFRKSAVLEILPLILDKHIDYDYLTDYDKTIEQAYTLFDDAIGYNVAIMVLEMFMSTGRSNISERNSKLSISNLKLEIEGYRNEAGALVAKGLTHKLSNAIIEARYKIFPYKVIVQDGNAW